MRFSVLVPVYNVSQYLGKCLDSIVSQDHNDFEVIIVDDGSTDGSGGICDRYSKDYPGIIKVIHKENQGLISARRVGIANASGDYCVFVDSDDYVSPVLLSSLSKFIEENGVEIVLYSFTYFDDKGGFEIRRPLFENGRIWTGSEKKELYETLATTPLIDAMFIKAIKTSVVKGDKTDYSIYFGKNMSEDTLQSIYPLTFAKSVGYLDKSLYYYRYNPQSISRDYSPETINKKNSVHVYYEILKYLPIWGLDTEEFKNKVSARWFSEAMYLFVKCYESASSRAARHTVLNYDWDSMIPEPVLSVYTENVSSAYLKLYRWLKKDNYIAIKWYFFKKKMYCKYKEFKKV